MMVSGVKWSILVYVADGFPTSPSQYKSHLVSFLNENPTHSLDRLTRVRQVQSSKTSKAKVLIIIRKAATDAEEG